MKTSITFNPPSQLPDADQDVLASVLLKDGSIEVWEAHCEDGAWLTSNATLIQPPCEVVSWADKPEGVDLRATTGAGGVTTGAEPDSWRDAVLEQLEAWHIYAPAIHDHSPRLAIKALVNIETKAALDPAVSSQAAALASQAAPAVPEIDYQALIRAAYATNNKWAQGTNGCSAFARGAEWFRELLLAATTAAHQPENTMSNEQKLREAFEARTTDNGKWPRAVEQGRNGCYLLAQTENAWAEWQACAEALATTEPDHFEHVLDMVEPEPTGMPELPPAGIPEDPLQLDVGDLFTIKQMRDYGKQCWKAGYKHGAWGDKPAVNQQLTTEPLDDLPDDMGSLADYFGDLAQQKADLDASRGVSMPVSYYASTVVAAALAWQARAAITEGANQ